MLIAVSSLVLAAPVVQAARTLAAWTARPTSRSCGPLVAPAFRSGSRTPVPREGNTKAVSLWAGIAAVGTRREDTAPYAELFFADPRRAATAAPGSADQ